MKLNNRITIKIAGESGMGINSSGEMLVNAVKDCGLYVFGYREYPSLIEGGKAFYQVDISQSPISSSQQNADIIICISRESIFEYLPTLKENGILIHCLPKLVLNDDQKSLISSKKISLVFFDTEKILAETKATKILTNILLLGYLWKLLGIDYSQLTRQIKETFAKKPEVVAVNEKHLKIGYDYEGNNENSETNLPDINISDWKTTDLQEQYVITGNHSLSLGSIHAGVRAFFAYPMTPASSILSYLASTSHKTGIVIKQAEDEISAAQMTLGAMHAGTRSFTATSGGGYDLMTETISLAGITETPMVVVLAQRPGPGTGLPTWTSAGDLNLALYSSHGEFPRCVIATSDAKDNFSLIQEAFNIAEEYQIPVIVLTEKQIAESHYLVDNFDSAVPIKRGLAPRNTDKRYSFEDVVSPRWLPGSDPNWYKANSDEHDEFGNSIEDAGTSKKMYEKRMKKLDVLRNALPEPTIYGDKNAKKIIIGWGSVKNVVLDCLPEKDVAYLHFSYIWPLKTELLNQLIKDGKEFYLVENNYIGQLGKLLEQETEIKFIEKFLKYDGRPFFVEEVNEFLTRISK